MAAVTLSVPIQKAYAAYAEAARAKPGTVQAKAFKTAQNFEATFFQNMLESMTTGLSGDGPLGAGQAGGGAWRGFLLDEMSRGMARAPSSGLASPPMSTAK